jgi:hypothetical protein
LTVLKARYRRLVDSRSSLEVALRPAESLAAAPNGSPDQLHAALDDRVTDRCVDGVPRHGDVVRGTALLAVRVRCAAAYLMRPSGIKGVPRPVQD